jgi:hypothetical protein
MTIHWHKLIVKLLFWLMTEAILNVVGLDNLADYSEFLIARNLINTLAPASAVVDCLGQ